MKLTPAQFRDAIGLTQETLRHWRRVLPIYQGHTGYAPTFSAGDMLTGAIIKTLVDTCGVSVSKFAEQSCAIGEVCNNTSWEILSESVLVLSLSESICILIKKEECTMLNTLCVTVPLGPIVEHLTLSITSDSEPLHYPISFPPMINGQRKLGDR